MSDGKDAADVIRKRMKALPKAPQYLQKDVQKWIDSAEWLAKALEGSAETKETAAARVNLTNGKAVLIPLAKKQLAAQKALDDAKAALDEGQRNVFGLTARLNESIKEQIDWYDRAVKYRGDVEGNAGTLAKQLADKKGEPEMALSKLMVPTWSAIAQAFKSVDKPVLQK